MIRSSQRCLLWSLLGLTLCLFLTQQAQGQSLKAYEKAAQEAYENESYYNAMYYYEIVLRSKQTPQLYYNYAQSCRLSYAYELAEEAYAKVINSRDKKRFPMLEYYYGATLKHNAKYTEAKRAFKYFLDSYEKDNFYRAKAQQELLSCDFAQQLLRDSLSQDELDFIHLDSTVNTKYSDFGAHWVDSTLYYSSLRFERKREKGEKINREEDQPLVSKILSTPDPDKKKGKVVKNLNEREANSANSAISHDGKYLYFTRCGEKTTDSLRCEIYRSERLDNGKWGAPERLPNPINSNVATTTHPSLAWDPNTQTEWLYFASDRAGGKGSLDIWRVALAEDLTQVQPSNLGDVINSIDAEVTPFFDPMTERLYFASRWHFGLGGYDIFYSQWNGSDWEAPVNLGLPFNSAANDLYYVVTPGSNPPEGYLASNRDGSRSLTKEACCNDIYSYAYKNSITPPPSKDTIPVVAIVPPPPIEPKDPPPVVPPVEPKDPPVAVTTPPDEPDEPITTTGIVEQLDSLLPLSLYFHNDEPDSNVQVRFTNTPYEADYDHYLSLVPLYKQYYAGQFGAEQGPVAVAEVERFFNDRVRGEYNRTQEFLDKLLEALQQGVRLRLYIRGYTSPKADANYNIALSHRRVASLRSFLMRYKGGALKTYVENGALDIREAMLGESVAPAGISDDPNDPANSIYGVAASRERKAELSVVLLQQ